ncbi:MAG TPA: oligosaccharide flippase family protein [Solirubrobacteraceae bacterium]|nr:oligosaccharide flippase family protein [Solirubrobacteraceae bacterium]
MARNAGLALTSQLVSAGFTAILTIVLARRLGPGGYGVFAIAVGLGAVLVLPADAGLSSSVARFVAERVDDRSAVGSLLADALRLKAAIAVIVCAVLFGLAGPIAGAYGISSLAWPIRAIAIAVFGQTIFMLYAGAFVALGRMNSQLRMMVSESAVEFAVSMALVLLGAGATGAAFGRAAGYLFGALVGVALTTKLVGRHALPSRLIRGHGFRRQIAGYARVLVIVDSAFTLFEQMDVLLIGAYLGATAAGLFQAPLRLATFLHYGGVAGGSAVAPRLARAQNSAPDSVAFLQALRWLLLIQAALIAPVLVWASPLLHLGLGGGYGESADVLRALTPYIFLSGIAPLVSLGVNYLGEAPARIPIAVAAIGANLAIDVILIPRIGIIAGAIGSDVGYAIYVPAHLWVCRRSLEVKLQPLTAVLARALLAAGAMCGVLALAGTSATLALWQWALGAILGPLAFLAVLLLSGELSREELRTGWDRLRSRQGAAGVTRPDPPFFSR